MTWDNATIDQLRALWAEGHSSAAIARMMGTTKNAIMGKAHRLQLASRPSPVIKGQPIRPRAVVRPKVTLAPLEIIACRRTTPVGEWVKPAPKMHVNLGGRAAVKVSLPPLLPDCDGFAPSPLLPGRVGCRFPLWPHGTRPPAGEHRFCDAPRVTSSDGQLTSYCATHRAICTARAA